MSTRSVEDVRPEGRLTGCFTLTRLRAVVSIARILPLQRRLALAERCLLEEGKNLEAAEAADLQSQLEELLSAVRGAEENWRFDDRLDLAARIAGRRPS